MDYDGHIVITDLMITFHHFAFENTFYHKGWHRIEKELCLHQFQQTAWLHVAQAKEEDLTTDDLVVTDIKVIKVGEPNPNTDSDSSWETRAAGVWVRRSKYTGHSRQAITAIDVLFGVDAVEPRPQWSLLQTPLQLSIRPELPVAKLSVRRGMARPNPPAVLRVNGDGKFKVLQISDTHMITGVGVARDAMGPDGQPLPKSEADPLTVQFLGEILDVEKPDLVLLTGDHVHHDILDTQSALFKVVAPLVERSIPHAAVFGNHDDEGIYALSRE